MTNPQDQTSVLVQTALGTVRGTQLGDTCRFGGIPFAEAPIGERRFRAPVAKAPWDGELDATGFGPICPQNPSFMDIMFGLEPEPQDEDCLRLNVFTPTSALGSDHAGGLPVMVWIHGGAFEMGSGSTDIYDGRAFTRHGVVFVSINYRLGPLGFLELSGVDPSFAGSGNCGLLDQIEALRWVQANIDRFGGNPEQVTVFGESAGSMSTSLLMSSPLTNGLFSQAICQSGGANAARDLESAQADGADVLARGGWSSIEEAQNAPLEELLMIHAALAMERWGNPDALLDAAQEPTAAMAFRPVADGVVVPIDPLGAIRDGAAAGVSLIAGHNLEEWKLFAMLMPSAQDDDELHRRAALLAADSDAEAIIAAYRADHPEATAADIECAIISDVVFRLPTVDLVDAQSAHADVWQYQFNYKTPVLGAAHAVELPFVFDQLHDPRLAPLFGDNPPAPIASAMSGSWARFAIDGAPSLDADVTWPATGGASTREVLYFDHELTVATDPLATSLNYWR